MTLKDSSVLNDAGSLSKTDFEKLSSFIYTQSGIKMPESKKVMLEARLRKRLHELKIDSYGEYCKFLFSSEGKEKEITHMIDIVTTNKTDFFRESKQFALLACSALPELIKLYEAGLKRPVRIWSAGCSTGEEPYTIAMVVDDFGRKFVKYQHSILATDISTRVLEKAVSGIYEEDRLEPVPHEFVKRYFLKSKDRQKKLVRATPELRGAIKFAWLNFMDDDYGFTEKFDVIFCRNVIIYFDKPTQDRLIAKLLGHINTGGYLFLGHSESIFDTTLPVVQVAASTYKKIR